ncbi:MAG: hypothetical protein ACRYGK_14445 [Janthinobacterium lividum]
MPFDKASLFAALKPKTSAVPVEGFGDVQIKQLAVSEVEAIRAQLKKDNDNDSFGLRLLTASVFDDDGAAVFSEADLPEIRASSNEAIEKLVTGVLELNGFRKADAGN